MCTQTHTHIAAHFYAPRLCVHLKFKYIIKHVVHKRRVYFYIYGKTLKCSCVFVCESSLDLLLYTHTHNKYTITYVYIIIIKSTNRDRVVRRRRRRFAFHSALIFFFSLIGTQKGFSCGWHNQINVWMRHYIFFFKQVCAQVVNISALKTCTLHTTASDCSKNRMDE